jgi:hypothetical protein
VGFFVFVTLVFPEKALKYSKNFFESLPLYLSIIFNLLLASQRGEDNKSVKINKSNYSNQPIMFKEETLQFF